MKKGYSMKRRDFLNTMTLGTSAVALTGAERGAEAATPDGLPNIVYILADDMGYGDPRCNNS